MAKVKLLALAAMFGVYNAQSTPAPAIRVQTGVRVLMRDGVPARNQPLSATNCILLQAVSSERF